MKKNNKILMLLLIVILAVSGISSGAFAAGGQSGDPKPTLEITKFRPKEATEYSWEIGGSFGDWTDVGDGNFQTAMDMAATRTMEKDDLLIHIEANLSLNATEALIVEFGYTVITEDDPDTLEVDEHSEGFVTIRRFEDVSYTRIDPAKEQIKFDFTWEDIDRSLFDDPETDDGDEATFDDIEGINQVRVVVPYVKSRGNIGEVTASKELGLEEHEAYGFVEVQSNFQAVLEEARSVVEPVVTVDCPTTKTNWLLDFDVLPLGQGDEFLLQTTVTTNDPTALEADLVQFQAYPYMENNEEYHVWDGVDWDEEILMAVYDMTFPVTDGYVPPSADTSLSKLTIKAVVNTESDETTEVFDPIEIALAPGQLEYTVEMPIGADLVNYEVVAIQADPLANVEILQATMESRVAVITVTAENGDVQEYKVRFIFLGDSDANLSDLTLDAVTIDDFDPTQVAYRVEYDEGEKPVTLPEVEGVAFDTNAAIAYSEVDNSADKSGYPMTKYVTVTAEDQTMVRVYSVLFCDIGWLPEDEEEDEGNSGGNGKRGSKLAVLAVDNKVVDGFDPEVLSYDVMLAEDTLALPQVTAVAEDTDAIVQHIKPTRLPGQYKLKVSANVVDPEDETAVIVEESIYTLNMDVEGLEEGQFIELGAAPISGETKGLWLPPTTDGFILNRTSTQIRFWTSNPLLTPKLLIFKDEGDEKLLTGELTLMATILTSDLKANGGGGKHSRTTVENGDGGYYKYNLKGRNVTNLVEGDSYLLVLYDGNNIVDFHDGQPAMLHFVMGEQVKGSVDHRNRDLNISGRNSN
jgi:hypothetical protein